MRAYRVEVVHQVTETYMVQADSREEAWHKVSETGWREDVMLMRTDHGKREVWTITRDVRDHTELPPEPEPFQPPEF